MAIITKTKVRLLIVGCGDIGVRLANQLPHNEFAITGLRRSTQHLPATIEPISCDLNDHNACRKAIQGKFDYWLLTLTPNQRDETGYRRTYLNNLQVLLALAQANHTQPKHLLFVSSTSVYGQNKGEWVDVDSATEPESYRGRIILEAEKLCANINIPTTIIRFSGIYGPGRDRLIKQVECGEWSQNDSAWTNRIHTDDAASVLAWCLRRLLAGEVLGDRYLASDCQPATKNTVCAWMADRLAAPPSKSSPGHGSLNKRCCNKKLLAEGFVFSNPSYREGYRRLLAERVLTKNNFFDGLEPYKPTIVSTIWTGLDIDGSDIDVACEYRNRAQFIFDVRTVFSSLPEFAVSENAERVLVSFKLAGFVIEIYASDIPVHKQSAVSHFNVMTKLVEVGGAEFQQRIRGLKNKGLKTEPAIAEALQLSGDPYTAVAQLESRSAYDLAGLLRPEVK